MWLALLVAGFLIVWVFLCLLTDIKDKQRSLRVYRQEILRLEAELVRRDSEVETLQAAAGEKFPVQLVAGETVTATRQGPQWGLRRPARLLVPGSGQSQREHYRADMGQLLVGTGSVGLLAQGLCLTLETEAGQQTAVRLTCARVVGPQQVWSELLVALGRQAAVRLAVLGHAPEQPVRPVQPVVPVLVFLFASARYVEAAVTFLAGGMRIEEDVDFEIQGAVQYYTESPTQLHGLRSFHELQPPLLAQVKERA